MHVIEAFIDNPETVVQRKDAIPSLALSLIGIGFGVTLIWITFLGWAILYVVGGFLTLAGL